MKNKLIVFAFLLAFLFESNAQDHLGRLHPGYVINNNQEFLNGFILMENKIDNQSRVKFYTEDNIRTKPVTYKPEDIAGYKVADRIYDAIPFGDIRANKLNFVLRVGDGEIKTYLWYHNEKNVHKVIHEDKLESYMVLRKGDEKPVNIAKFILFAKNMSEYVKDHSDLSERIVKKEKGYGLLNLDKIIEEYNEWYSTQQE
jgi:hypothetical protein